MICLVALHLVVAGAEPCLRRLFLKKKKKETEETEKATLPLGSFNSSVCMLTYFTTGTICDLQE